MGKVELKETDERRIFYVDVGSLPPERVKKYLEEIKKQMKDRPLTATSEDLMVMKDSYWI